MTDVTDIGPLDWRVSITDSQGRPSPEFQRRWNSNRNNTSLITPTSFGSGVPVATSTVSDGSVYFDQSHSPYISYVAYSGSYIRVSPIGADPSSVLSDIQSNGTATTFMRSDASPAVQKGSSTQFGIFKNDGLTITSISGILSVPTATISSLGLVQPDNSTITISAGLISVPTATNSILGLVKPDGTTITISGGVISSVGGGGGGGGGGTSTIPVVRSSNIQVSSNSSYTVTWPSGTSAGDLVVIVGGHGYNFNNPSGWSVIDNQAGSNFNGAAWWKVMDAADITAGSVALTTAGSFDGVISAVTIKSGTYSGVGTFVSSRSSSGSTSVGLTTDTTPTTSDLMVYFGGTRANVACSETLGTSLQVTGAGNASATLNAGTPASSGALSPTFNFAAAGSGYYVIAIRIVAAAGSGGSTVPGGAWTQLSFSPTTSAHFGQSLYTASPTFALAAGQRLEIEGYVYKSASSSDSRIYASTNGTDAYHMSNQSDGNLVLYRYSGGTNTPFTASGSSSDNTYAGRPRIKLIVNARASLSNAIIGEADWYITQVTRGDTSVQMVGTVTIYMASDDATKCTVMARVIQ